MFNRSAPECSLLFLFLKRRSQSVTPHSCQVPKNRVSFFALLDRILKFDLHIITLFAGFQELFSILTGNFKRSLKEFLHILHKLLLALHQLLCQGHACMRRIGTLVHALADGLDPHITPVHQYLGYLCAVV